MSQYHFHMEQIKRSAGQKVMASAAYRAGEKLYSNYYGVTCDYTKKGGVIHTEIMLPPHAPREYEDRLTLWDAVEYAERGKNAQLAHSFDIALQNEFSIEENIALARQFVSEQLVARGMIADLAVHMPNKDGGISNPHFHVMCPIRPLNLDGTWGMKQRREYLFDENGAPVLDDAGHQKFNAVPTTDWSLPETLEEMRRAWAEMCNAKFEEKGLDCRIDHRSYERQGIEQVPTVHEGPHVRQMEARGIETDKGKLNRWIRSIRRTFTDIKAMITELKEALNGIKAEMSKFDAENIATLLNAYYDKRNARACSKKARAANFQKHVETFNYLQSKGIATLDDLKETVSKMGDDVSERQKSIRNRQDRMKELTDLIHYAESYQRTRPIYDEMNAIRWKKKREAFRREHDGELRLFYASRRHLAEHVNGKKLPVQAWKKELNQLTAENDADYAELKETRTEFWKLKKIKDNLESALAHNEQHHRRETPER